VLLVFLDSLPDMFHDTMDILQSILSETPLAPEGCKLIHASMPRQGIRMMDCGIFMACMAWLYTKGLLACGCFSVNRNASDFTYIIITFNCNAIIVGGAGHDHMLTLIHLGQCDLDTEVFNLCSIKWSQLHHVCL
jgi:hypothetical protein